jgi:xanthine dehydrogenase YagS FAD-binding subunit
MSGFEWINALSLAEASREAAAGGTPKAGGVDLLDLLKERLIAPTRLVNLRSVPDLDRIEPDGDGLAIGPLVTLARIATDARVLSGFRALAQAAGHTATPQIRNMATIGGNLLQRPRCWYFRSEHHACKKKGGAKCFAQDGQNAYHAVFGNGVCAAVNPSTTSIALVALGAKLELTTESGAREIELEQLFVRPEDDVLREHALQKGEIISEVRLPAPAAGATSAYIKQGEKESFDWPLAEVAVLLEMDGARCRRASIVLGAAAPIPYRAIDAEKALAGQEINEQTAQGAARAAVRGATPLAQNGYKVSVIEATVARTILAAAKREGAGR